MKNPSRYFRLLPAVIVVGFGLLVAKGFTIVEEARAQSAMTGQAPAPAPKDFTHVAVTDPVIDDSESNSAAEVDVLTSLSKRRQQLDAREQSLNMQANLIAAAEQRVDGKITALKDLQATMQKLLGQRDTAEQAQLTALVKSYSSMKPADAARIFNSLDETVQLDVAAQMKSDVLGAILAKMQPDAAQKLTVRLANRLNPPQVAPAAIAAATAPEVPAAQQIASVDPASQIAANTATPAPSQAPATTPAQPATNAAPAAVPPAEAKPQPQQSAANTAKPAEQKPATAAPKQAAATPPAQPKQQASVPAPAKPDAKAPAAPAKPDASKQAAATPAKAPAPPPAAKAKGG